MKNLKQNVNTTWLGIKRLYAIISELVTGLSALAVMGMAAMYARQHQGNRPLFAVSVFAIAVMGIVAAKALGGYLNKLGSQHEQ